MINMSSPKRVGRGHDEGFKGGWNFTEGVKCENLKRLGWKRNMYSPTHL